MQQHAAAGQFRVGPPAGLQIITEVTESRHEIDMFDLALHKILAQLHKAPVELARIAYGKLYLVLFGQADKFRRLFEIPRRRRQLQDVEFLFHRCSHIFIATVYRFGYQQAIELILNNQLPVIIVSGTLVFAGDFLGEIRILVGHGLNFQTIHRLGGLQQKLPARIETKYRRIQFTFIHTRKNSYICALPKVVRNKSNQVLILLRLSKNETIKNQFLPPEYAFYVKSMP